MIKMMMMILGERWENYLRGVGNVKEHEKKSEKENLKEKGKECW